MDLNVMMREQALAGLNRDLDDAVTNGDTAKARDVTKKIADLTAASAPKGPPYGDAEIRAELEKAPWFGIDPKKSAKAVEFGKTMDIKKFATPALFAEALIKAVDEEFKPPAAAKKDPPENETDEEREAREAEEAEAAEAAAAEKKPKKTDGPGDEGMGGARSNNSGRGSTRAWAKLSDAPRDVQAEIKRQADKFVPATAKPEVRTKFISDALAVRYAQHQRTKGKS